jgi:branched-chain amino acid transport system ATP-binding protein
MPEASVILQASEVRAGYGHLEVIHGVSLSVAAGEFVALLGANGAGKSTLLRVCAGQLRPRGGTVVFDGTDLATTAPHRVAKLGLGYATEGRRVFERQSVAANLELGAYPLGGRNRRTGHLFDRVYELFPVLARKAGMMASTLSGGERQMLAVAQALMVDPRLVVLDEPSAGLAPRLIEDVFAALAQLRAGGLAMLLAEQTVEQSLGLCDRGYVLEAGTVALSGDAATLRADPAVREIYIGALGHGAAPDNGSGIEISTVDS